MSSHPLRALLPVAACLLAGRAQADLSFADFSFPVGVNFLGDAHVAANKLRLTNDASDERGVAWFTTAQKVSNNWAAEFVFQLEGGPGADGFAFVLQNTSTSSMGAGGCELGYHGIANSVAIEFDSFANGSCSAGSVNDFGSPHVSVHTLGTAPNSVEESASIGASLLVPAFNDGGVHTARVHYIPGTLYIFIDDFVTPVLTLSVDLQQTLSLAGNEDAWVGFSGATGGLSESHDIHSFSFDEDATFGGGGNNAPAQPTITEPSVDGLVVNPADVHMEGSPFSDPDAGDQHLCTDFEIWRISPSERVWFASCATGATKLHAHLADGAFEGSHAGGSELQSNTQFLLRIRYRDDSSDSASEWSAWGQRLFSTGSASDVFPFETGDIKDQPELGWTYESDGFPTVLPSGATQPFLRLDHPQVGTLLEISGLDGLSNNVLNPVRLSQHTDVRAWISGGSTGLNLPASNLVVYDDDCTRVVILLPALTLSAGQSEYYWIASNGSTYSGNSGQNSPNFNNLARGLALPWSVRQPGYEVEVFASDLQLPVNIAFVPAAGPEPSAPFLYVTELYGQIKVVTRDGTVSTYASGLLDFNPTGAFPGSGEQGVAGIAVDPVSGDVFASLLHDSVTSPGTHYPMVQRFSSNDGGLTAATQTTIIDFVGEPQGQSHQISNLTIHPDGKLIVHMGDGFNSSTAQNFNSYRGKILRMNLDGSAATDNPFYDAGDGIGPRDYILSYGVRNPFGGAYRTLDGNHYTVENGPSIDRIGKALPGRNFGWTGSDPSMLTHAIYSWSPAHGPVNIAFVQPQTFGGSGFPADKQDHAFVSESGPTYAGGGQARGKRIVEFVFDANGDLASGPFTFLEYGGTGKETSVGLAAGPDGLYMTSLYKDQGFNPTASGARIYRVYRTPGWDCNDNGIDDACDIATGVEQDLNGNGTPDSCDCSGATFCQSTTNSTGSPALISSNGLCDVASNQFALAAGPVPDGPGLFFFSTNQAGGGNGVPFYNGLRCVGPGILRLPAIMASGGAANYQLDFTTIPANQIQPGSTWNFQYWFRDVAGGGTAVNLSDGLSVSFQ